MVGCSFTQAEDSPSHDRPYFMPQSERDRIFSLIQQEDWAKAEYKRVKEAAEKGDGYWSAFLYALEGNGKYLQAARNWLLIYGRRGGDIHNVHVYLSDPDFFKAGQHNISQVYYNLDISHMVAYDWVYNGLNPEERKIIEEGILTSARFRMQCMDRWSQTPNLVFKPTYMVAMAGLVTGNPELLEWGFYRKPGSNRGGYFHVLDTMLRDGGPWAEAPIYPIAHKNLLLMAKMAWYRGLYDGKDWFNHKSPNGGSPKGLMDYYIDTAYPIERTGYGSGQIRVATYGDGSTGSKGDLFLVNPAEGWLDMTEVLAAAYGVSGDSRYATFLTMVPDYKPNFVGYRPLPEAGSTDQLTLPPAPSKIWPSYGLAMLRSDESPAYWTSGNAIAVFQLMTQSYGHEHRDKLSIMLHGAGRLFYPDYNAVQYENPSVGWTSSTIAHNTMVVDEGETRSVVPTGIRYEFTPEVKFLATSASGVFEGVDQTRALLLTKEYLLDLFHATSKVPHTYDYVLHSFGKPQPGGVQHVKPLPFKPSTALMKRYWMVENQQASTTNDLWSLDFVIKEEPGSRKGKYGKEWYDHTATLRLTMAAEPNTVVVHGVGPKEIPTLVVRRMDLQDTVFVATHEPFANSAEPEIRKVTRLARTQDAIVVRVDAKDYIDYAAITFGPQKGTPVHALASTVGVTDLSSLSMFAFKNYGYLRVLRDGRMIARGDWTGFQIPLAELNPAADLKQVPGSSLTMNGQPAKVEYADGYLIFGKVPSEPDPPLLIDPENPFPMKVSSGVVRLAPQDGRLITFTIQNVLKEAVSGRLEFELPENLAIKPARPEFGPVPPGNTATVSVTFMTDNSENGRYVIPYRLVYRSESNLAPTKEIRTATKKITVIVGPVLEYLYQYPQSSAYLVNGPRYIARLDMFQGLLRYFADDDNTPRLDGSPLFTFSDGQKDLLFEGTEHASTWQNEVPAWLHAHVYDRARYRIFFFNDRLSVIMDPDWTQFEKTHFTIPGKWVSPQGTPQWKHIVTVDETGKEFTAPSIPDISVGVPIKVIAAELAFPQARWNLCFEFKSQQEVFFIGPGMKFQLDSLNGDSWSVGFCKPGKLDTWRWKALSVSSFWPGFLDRIKQLVWE